MRIPSWSEAEYNIKSGNGTALDEFVYWHEPEGELEEHDFRQDLRELIDFLLQPKQIMRPNDDLDFQNPLSTLFEWDQL